MRCTFAEHTPKRRGVRGEGKERESETERGRKKNPKNTEK